MAENHPLKIKPNTLFAWPKGQRMTSLQSVTLMFPGGLVREDESIGSIIEVSDEAWIGFQDAQQPGDVFHRIILKLAPGQMLRINRGTQAMLVQPSQQPVWFTVED